MAIKSSNSGVRKGDVIRGRYEVMSLIGEGGMSRVFLASDRQLTNKLWAIKEVDRRATDPAGRPIEASLAMEAELLSKVDHPNIVDIVDIEKTDDFIYVVMDYVEGRSLDEVVRMSGPQDEADVQRWMLEICDALECLHRQNPPIVYRDMKPNNIMLHPDGYVKLIDFGVSREYKDDVDKKKDTIAFGTTGYAAPEQYGKAQSDARTDIYGVGATMWHLLGGEAPPSAFPLPSVRTVNPSVSEGFSDVIIPKCTKVDRSERYQSCDELAADLEIYEELNKDFRKSQLNKITAFAVTLAAAVFFLLAGFAFGAAHDSQVNDTYDSHLDRAAKALSSANANVGTSVGEEYYLTAVEEYIAAIETKPTDMDGWAGLIDSYEVDGEFDTDEKKQFDELYGEYQSQLADSSIMPELSYDIGRMYWFFYTYGQEGGEQAGSDVFQNSASNQTARIKASSDYFRIAAESEGFSEQSSAQIFNEIASFTANLEREVQQGGETREMYESYFHSLQNLLELAERENVEIARYNTYLLIANSLESYMTRFAATDSITRNDVESLWESVLGAISKDGRLSASTDEIRQSIESKEGSISQRIGAAYSSSAFSVNTLSSSGE